MKTVWKAALGLTACLACFSGGLSRCGDGPGRTEDDAAAVRRASGHGRPRRQGPEDHGRRAPGAVAREREPAAHARGAGEGPGPGEARRGARGVPRTQRKALLAANATVRSEFLRLSPPATSRLQLRVSPAPGPALPKITGVTGTAKPGAALCRQGPAPRQPGAGPAERTPGREQDTSVRSRSPLPVAGRPDRRRRSRRDRSPAGSAGDLAGRPRGRQDHGLSPLLPCRGGHRRLHGLHEHRVRAGRDQEPVRSRRLGVGRRAHGGHVLGRGRRRLRPLEGCREERLVLPQHGDTRSTLSGGSVGNPGGPSPGSTTYEWNVCWSVNGAGPYSGNSAGYLGTVYVIGLKGFPW